MPSPSRSKRWQPVARPVCGLRFAGPMALGTLALVTFDPDTRQAALDEGQEILKSECVSHNYLWFYRDTMETALQTKQWALLDRLTLAAETYTENEPLPWMTLLVKRARLLAANSKNPDAVDTVAQIKDLRDEVSGLGFKSLLGAIDAVLEPG